MGSLSPEKLVELGMEHGAKTQDVHSESKIHLGNEEKEEEQIRHGGEPSGDSPHRRLSILGNV